MARFSRSSFISKTAIELAPIALAQSIASSPIVPPPTITTCLFWQPPANNRACIPTVIGSKKAPSRGLTPFGNLNAFFLCNTIYSAKPPAILDPTKV